MHLEVLQNHVLSSTGLYLLLFNPVLAGWNVFVRMAKGNENRQRDSILYTLNFQAENDLFFTFFFIFQIFVRLILFTKSIFPIKKIKVRADMEKYLRKMAQPEKIRDRNTSTQSDKGFIVEIFDLIKRKIISKAWIK